MLRQIGWVFSRFFWFRRHQTARWPFLGSSSTQASSLCDTFLAYHWFFLLISTLKRHAKVLVWGSCWCCFVNLTLEAFLSTGRSWGSRYSRSWFFFRNLGQERQMFFFSSQDSLGMLQSISCLFWLRLTSFLHLFGLHWSIEPVGLSVLPSPFILEHRVFFTIIDISLENFRITHSITLHFLIFSFCFGSSFARNAFFFAAFEYSFLVFPTKFEGVFHPGLAVGGVPCLSCRLVVGKIEVVNKMACSKVEKLYWLGLPEEHNYVGFIHELNHFYFIYIETKPWLICLAWLSTVLILILILSFNNMFFNEFMFTEVWKSASTVAHSYQWFDKHFSEKRLMLDKLHKLSEINLVVCFSLFELFLEVQPLSLVHINGAS